MHFKYAHIHNFEFLQEVQDTTATLGDRKTFYLYVWDSAWMEQVSGATVAAQS